MPFLTTKLVRTQNIRNIEDSLKFPENPTMLKSELYSSRYSTNNGTRKTEEHNPNFTKITTQSNSIKNTIKAYQLSSNVYKTYNASQMLALTRLKALQTQSKTHSSSSPNLYTLHPNNTHIHTHLNIHI